MGRGRGPSSTTVMPADPEGLEQGGPGLSQCRGGGSGARAGPWPGSGAPKSGRRGGTGLGPPLVSRAVPGLLKQFAHLSLTKTVQVGAVITPNLQTGRHRGVSNSPEVTQLENGAVGTEPCSLAAATTSARGGCTTSVFPGPTDDYLSAQVWAGPGCRAFL